MVGWSSKRWLFLIFNKMECAALYCNEGKLWKIPETSAYENVNQADRIGLPSSGSYALWKGETCLLASTVGTWQEGL